MTRTSRHKARRMARGFTLIELMVVVLIIALVSAMTLPRLVPLIAYSNLEGNARRLASYGRAVNAQALFMHERQVVRFDLDEEPQCYFTVHWVIPEDEEQSTAAQAVFNLSEEDALAEMMMDEAMPGLAAARSQYDEEDLDKYFELRGLDPTILDPEQTEMLLLNLVIDDQFLAFQREGLEARAENVKHPEGVVSEIGPLFGKEEKFELDKVEPVEEELQDPVLQRVFLPKGLTLEAVSVDGDVRSRGTVEVEFSALGLSHEVGFHLVNEDDEYYTVYWDPVTGVPRCVAGKEDI